MFVCRYAADNLQQYGRVEHDNGRQYVVPVDYYRALGRWVNRKGRARPVEEVRLLPPAEPSKIVCVTLNYAADEREAATEQRAGGAAAAAILVKPPSSLAAPGHSVSHPGIDWILKHEAELAIVIGKTCKRVPAGRAADVIAGYTCANDITAYARRQPTGPSVGYPPIWAKHFDGSTPLGPWMVTDLDPAALEIACTVGGETRQQGNTRDLIWPVHEVVSLVSEHMTLLPGDVILTGTPAGSGPLEVGNSVEVSVSGIGTLRNVVSMPCNSSGTPEAAGKAGPLQAFGDRAASGKGRARL